MEYEFNNWILSMIILNISSLLCTWSDQKTKRTNSSASSLSHWRWGWVFSLPSSRRQLFPPFIFFVLGRVRPPTPPSLTSSTKIRRTYGSPARFERENKWRCETVIYFWTNRVKLKGGWSTFRWLLNPSILFLMFLPQTARICHQLFCSPPSRG